MHEKERGSKLGGWLALGGTLAALVALIVLTMPGGMAQAGALDTVQPGDPVVASNPPQGGACAISYVLASPSDVYLALPSACTSPGGVVSTPSVSDVGTVVHQDEAVQTSLVLVNPSVEDQVLPHVRNHPEAPQGVTQAPQAGIGDPVFFPRGAATVAYMDAHEVRVSGTADAPPNGAPIVHAGTGTVAGHVNGVQVCFAPPNPYHPCGLPPAHLSGPTTQAVIEAFNDAGFPVDLVTVQDEGSLQGTLGESAGEAAREATGWEPVIQPGDPLVDGSGNLYCTLNFVFDGPQHVYIGTAGHCVNTGSTVHTYGFPSFGTVVAEPGGVDFALIQVDPAVEGHVEASVNGHPYAPAGVATDEETHRGDVVAVSGYGTGAHWHDATRENRWGVHIGEVESTFVAATPISPGDSGGPVVHAPTGKALGVSARIEACAGFPPTAECGLPPVQTAGPTVEAVLDALEADGFALELRTTVGEDPVQQAGALASSVTGDLLEGVP